MGANDGMGHVDQLFVRSLRSHPRRKHAAVVVRMHRTQPEQSLAPVRLEQLVGPSHVDELRVTTGAGRQLSCEQHGRERRIFRIGVVGVERLEQSRSNAVTAEDEIPELRSELIRENEAGVDDLTLVAVTEPAAVAGAADGILDRPDHRHEGARVVLGERFGKPDTHHRMGPQRGAQELRTAESSLSTARCSPTTSTAPKSPGRARTSTLVPLVIAASYFAGRSCVAPVYLLVVLATIGCDTYGIAVTGSPAQPTNGRR